MFRTLSVLSLLCYLSLTTAAQRISKAIVWPDVTKHKSNYLPKNSPENQGYKEFLWFDGNVDYPDLETMLPYYADIIPISNSILDINQINVSIVSQNFTPLNNSEKGMLTNGVLKVINKQKPIFNVFKSRGQSYLQYSIPTVQFNAFSQQVQKLVSFELEIQNVSSNVQLRQSLQKTSAQSVLAVGSWHKFSVQKTGVHAISYDFLVENGITNLSDVSIWGHNGSQLSFWNNEMAYDDLMQIPIWIDKGSDGVFGKGDKLYFYARGAASWQYNPEDDFFSHRLHGYTSETTYFITTNRSNPLRIGTSSPPVGDATYTSNQYDALYFFERNDTNLIKSGRQWFGESFDVYSARTYNPEFKNLVPSAEVRVKVCAAARSSVNSSFSFKANGNVVSSMSMSAVNTASQYTNFASINTKLFSFTSSQSEVELELVYNKPTPAAKAWLDYIDINARSNLVVSNEQLIFRDSKSLGSGVISEFLVTSSISDLMIWDVTDFFNPMNLPFETSGETSKIKVETEQPREFVAFTPSQVYDVDWLGEVPNQNIHGQPQPDMVIVAHPNFINQAQALAQLHSDHSGLKSLVVTTQQVYNEFSSGNRDVAAIRNMMRMFYQRSTSAENMPKYLLLFGDGSYDNVGKHTDNTNYIPTFQSENSLHVTSSFVSDDFFGLLDDNEGEATGLLDIGIGRIPCRSSAEADLAVSKISNYLSSSSQGSWNNQLCFIADDGDGNLHMRDADLHATFIEQSYPNYNIEKIYFDAFPLESMSVGDRYPGVTSAINSRANQGTLIMNYVGHANARWLGHERVLQINDIQSWRNFNKLSLFVTATCEFSRFDDFSYQSAGEHTLFAPLGGSVALVSTSRVVYANPNYTLNRNFLTYVFAERETSTTSDIGKHYRLGDVLRLSKIVTGGQINKRNFLLLGDPALQLHYPSMTASLSKINNVDVSGELDTLKALTKVDIAGKINNVKAATDFNGELEFTLFDKAKEVTTLANRGGEPFVFTTRPNGIYRGRSSVINGQFNASFIIPKDIMYNYGKGKFSLYAKSLGEIAGGMFDNFVVGGIGKDDGTDTEGPQMEIFMNSQNFVPGGITDQNPKMLVHFFDSSGINTTGVGIGHDLTATLIGDNEETFVLNDYYIADLDSYQAGKVEYQLSNLSPGPYKLRVKAWDVYNNSAEHEIDFTVRNDEGFALTHILNYPNPFTENTAFYFEHNRPYDNLEILIQIFSPSGKLVKTITHYKPGAGNYRVGPIGWDGLDDFGDSIGRGVYFYRLKVRLGSGQVATAYQKLVILK